MAQSLDKSEFISFRKERELCILIENTLDQLNILDEGIATRTNQIKNITTGELERAKHQADELLSRLAVCINSNNTTEAYIVLRQLEKLYNDFLLPYKTTHEAALNIKQNLAKAREILNVKSKGISTGPFTPILPSQTPIPQAYSKTLNIGNGIIGANKITYESKQV